MDRLFFFFQGMVEAVGMAIFLLCALVAVLVGMVYQLVFAPFRLKKGEEAPIVPPVSEPSSQKVDEKAKEAGKTAGKAPDQSTVDFFNQLGKP